MISFSCAEHYRKYTESQDEILQSVKSAESTLSQFICQKVTCLADCTDQQTKLGVRMSILLFELPCSRDPYHSPLCSSLSYQSLFHILNDSPLQVLSEEVESLQRRLGELNEWCPERSCRGGRESAVASVWNRVSRLRRCIHELTTRGKQRIAEWREITNSVSYRLQKEYLWCKIYNLNEYFTPSCFIQVSYFLFIFCPYYYEV